MSLYDYVNIRMGTKNAYRFSNGNALPLVALPHGMASFTIQSERRGNWFYDPDARYFEGVRLTHQPSPWIGDYGQLIVTGQHGTLRLADWERWSSYDPRACILEPAYMEAYIERDRYRVSLSPTMSGAVIDFVFDADADNRINFIGEEKTVFDVEEASGRILGYTTSAEHPPISGELREYFVITVDVPFTVERAQNALSLKIEGRRATVRLATSFLTQTQALLNYERELVKRSLGDVRSEARAAWERRLSCIEIEDEGEEAEQKKRTLYSCLWRAFLWPRRFYEIDARGEAWHLNMRTGKPTKGYFYTDNGFWDTYRTLYPLLSLLDTQSYAEMAEGYYNYYKDCGWLPKWLCPDNYKCMPGMLVEAVLSDAVVKGIVKGDVAEGILEAMLKDGEVAGEGKGDGRTGLAVYRQYGYVPYTAEKESVNETLDSCYGDYCIAQVAKTLGKREIAERYEAYAMNYKNLFDPDAGFIRAKDENGKWRDEVFDPFLWGRDYTEGSAWQNGFGVYHDIAGLDALYGGRLLEKMDELFATDPVYSTEGYGCTIHEMSEMVALDLGQCAISNQPSFHIPYIYSELGDVKRTAKAVERAARAFHSGTEGFPGDEDNGSMSAWYVLACLGMYAMCPSRPDFTMSLPLFEKMRVRLANGKTLFIDRSMMDAGQMKNKVAYADLMQGGALCEMVKPNGESTL